MLSGLPIRTTAPHARRTLWLGMTVALHACAFGCGGQHRATGATKPSTTARAKANSAAPAAMRPRLVVSVVFDQMGADTLQRHLALLDDDGAIRRSMAEGTTCMAVRYGHPATFTAPDHAALYTGAVPRDSGIVGNAIRHDDGHLRAAVNDGAHAVHGLDGSPLKGRHASPKALRVATLGDDLKAQASTAKVIAISLKDRGAILPGGHHPDAAVWFEPTMPGFTTSSFYGAARPAWVSTFAEAHPLQSLLVPWLAESEQALLTHLGPDAQAGEGEVPGLGNRFPHDPSATPAPYHALRMMPALSEYLLALAEHAVAAEGLGTDDVPDLLAISISGTDYAGHTFGPQSWEYVDHLRRADRALGQLITRLAEHTSVALVITSDHGVMKLPEQLDGGHPRLPGSAVVAAANAAIRSVLGSTEAQSAAAPAVEAFVEPYVYLNAAARAHTQRPAIVAAVSKAVAALPQVHAALDTAPLVRGEATTDLERDVATAVHPTASGDIYVVPAVGGMTELSSLPAAGTTHGSPWAYDRVVPGLAWGAGVPHGTTPGPIDHTQVTATLRHLLGLSSEVPPLWQAP